MRKIVLVAVNAKYIHSNLSVYSLKAYADARLRRRKRRIPRQKILLKTQMQTLLLTEQILPAGTRIPGRRFTM